MGLKGEIEKVANIPASQQKLVIKGKTIKDSEPLSTYNNTNDSIIVYIS